MRRTATIVHAVVFTVVVSAVVDLQSPGDMNHDTGCHTDWLGVVPIGGYCVFP